MISMALELPVNFIIGLMIVLALVVIGLVITGNIQHLGQSVSQTLDSLLGVFGSPVAQTG